MPSISEAPNERKGQKRFGYFPPGRAGFSKVTRRKGETIRSRYRSNGYATLKTHTPAHNSVIQLHSESDQAVAVLRPRAVNATHSR
jgi:hypothetical protein